MKLSREAKKWRKQLENEYDLSDSGAQIILTALLEAWDAMRAAQQVVKTEGLTVQDRFGQCKAHPLCTVIRDCRAQVLAGLKQLNLDIEPLQAGPGRPPGR